MRTVILIGLLMLAGVLYLARKRLPNESLERLANAVAVASLLAAALVFIVPPPGPQSAPTQASPPPMLRTPPPLSVTPSPTTTSTLSPSSTPTFTPSVTDVASPEITLNYVLPYLALGPGRVDLLRLYNGTSLPISVVSFGAVVRYRGQEVLVLCQEGICIPEAPFPDPIVEASVEISPEALFLRSPGAPTPDPFLIYPHDVPPGAADYVSKIAVWLSVEGETLPDTATIEPFLVLANGSHIVAPPVRAITLGPLPGWPPPIPTQS